jgi:hypothetical protein
MIDPDLHCSQGAVGSWTDPVSNQVRIGGLNPITDFSSIHLPGRFPSELRSVTLHECAHHWCFDTPVGLTLAMLQMRARRTALELQAKVFPLDVAADLRWRVFLDQLTYSSAIALLRPFAEGLALYAEHDAMPQITGTMSNVLAWLAPLFTNVPAGRERSEQDYRNMLRSELASNRQTPEHFERKRRLLDSPFHCKHGGYLAGYMFVKNLWALLVLRRQLLSLAITDVFMIYACEVVYGDWGLVDVLLDDTTNEVKAVNQVSQRIQGRLGNLLLKADASEIQKVVEDHAPENLHRMRDPGYGQHALLLAGTTRGEAISGHRRLLQLARDLERQPAFDTFDHAIYGMARESLANRDIVCLGETETDVSVNAHLRVKAGTPQIFPGVGAIHPLQTGALDGIKQGDGRGTIFSLLSTRMPARFFAVFRGTELVALSHMTSGDERIEELGHAARVHMAQRKFKQLGIEAVKSALNSTDNALLDHYSKEIASVCEFTYQTRALAWTPDDRLDSARAGLVRQGLAYATKTADLTHDLAWLSIASSIFPPREHASEMVEQFGVDFEKTLRRLADAEVTTGVRLVEATDRAVICFV